jgi:hypothetical protein
MIAILAKLIPFRDWLYLGAFIALIGAGVYERTHLINEGKAKEIVSLKKSSDSLNAAADAKVAQLTADHVKEVADLQEKFDEQQRASSLQSASDSDRLREYDAYRRSHPAVQSASSGPAAAGARTGSDSQVDSIAIRMEEVALGLADADRETLNALQSCMIERDSVTGK